MSRAPLAEVMLVLIVVLIALLMVVPRAWPALYVLEYATFSGTDNCADKYLAACFTASHKFLTEVAEAEKAAAETAIAACQQLWQALQRLASSGCSKSLSRCNKAALLADKYFVASLPMETEFLVQALATLKSGSRNVRTFLECSATSLANLPPELAVCLPAEVSTEVKKEQNSTHTGVQALPIARKTVPTQLCPHLLALLTAPSAERIFTTRRVKLP